MVMFLFGAFLPCVFIIGVTGFSLETNWPFLWVALPLLLFTVKIRATPAHIVGAAFLVWAAITTLWAPQWIDAVDKALMYGAVAAAFLLGAETDDQNLLKGLAVGLGINSAMAVAQSFGWGMSITGGTAAGLLFNGNALAIPAAIVSFIFLLDGRVLWALPPLPAILLPNTRAGFVILAVGFLAWLWTKHRIAALALLAIAAVVGTWSLDQGYRVPSTQQRVAIWKDTAAGLGPVGHGLGSFYGTYPRYATHIDTGVARPYHAHSDPLEVTFELGIFGLLFFILLGASCWAQARPRERIILLACVVVVALDFPLHVPTSAFLIAYLAGRGAAGWREDGVGWVDSGFGKLQGYADWRPVRNYSGL